ncbi:MAG: tRNA (adenosine(37)-N6)-dimethylallyltransferase MiaA, partial [Gammaproteobacteria bacterium]
CCDSMQVYQGLDIGTAKPDADERRQTPHFLLDCVRLPDTCSAARWARLARDVIRAENRAGRTPLIVGGTGLYLRALIEGLAEIPPEDAAVRERLAREAREAGTPALHARLAELDPETATRLARGDTQRILRALGVCETTGRPFSEWLRQSRASMQPVHCPVFVLDPPRDVLRERISRRFHAMMAAGWLDEVRWLASLGLPEAHPAMRAVGYRQLLAHLHGECSLEEAVSRGITATRRYAKRQRTWFLHQTPDAVRGEAETLALRIRRALAGEAPA